MLLVTLMMSSSENGYRELNCGMTAGILWLGLKILNAPKIGLYDEVCPFVPFPKPFQDS